MIWCFYSTFCSFVDLFLEEPIFGCKALKVLIFYFIISKNICQYVFDKRQNGWTDWAQILCGTSHDPGKVSGCTEFWKVIPKHLCFFVKFWKSTKNNHQICKSFLYCFFRCLHIEPQLKVEIEDERKAP